MAVYLKLGPKAASFTDSSLGIKLSNTSVIKVPSRYPTASKKLSSAISGGHVVKASKEEYENYIKEYAEMVEENHKKASLKNTLVGGKDYVKSTPVETKESEEEDDDLPEISIDGNPEELASQFTKDKLIEIAKEYGLENPKGTKVQLVVAIQEKMEEDENDSDDDE